MVPTMVLGRITVGGQWQLLSEIDLIIEVPDIGTAARIMSGGPDIGVGGTGKRYGSAAITSYAVTDPHLKRQQAARMSSLLVARRVEYRKQTCRDSAFSLSGKLDFSKGGTRAAFRLTRTSLSV